VTVRQSTELLGLSQDRDGVTAALRGPDGASEQVRALFLAGCDGGGGIVRKEIDAAWEGRAQLGTIYNIFFRCDDFHAKSNPGVARHYCFAGVGPAGGAAGVIVTQDDLKHFAYHTMAPPDFDPAQLLRELTGLDISPHILHSAPWNQHLLVTDRHSRGRVFLAGDANHLYVPAGGLGMNTGIGDAINLSWKLAAVIQGWGGPALLESYGIERGAVARRNRDAVAWAIEGVIQWRGAYTPLVSDASPAGAKAREDFIRLADPANRRVYEMHGADLGYRYDSPVISAEDGSPPESDITVYRPTTWPGAHLPHVWLGPGAALYDRLSTAGFTLLHLGTTHANAQRLELAFRQAGAPFRMISLDDPQVRHVYERDFVLIRPDLHVVWRGNRLPDSPEKLAAIATGHA
jgi:hypothetical protein